ncbi:MAG: GNAT family N-acetyltransferase [Alphaproteobacteria bacterium]|nr:GNAT family N-acetyltransferase [Alphaproteobacteria bacterium]
MYYTYPSDEDIYALFRNNAVLYRRDISTVVDLKERIPFNTRRKRNLKKAEKAGLEFKETTDFETYVSLLSDILKEKHNASPVHSAQELHLLKERFPENIKLYASFKEGQMMAGVLMFSTPKVAHAQYIMNSFDGRTIGALDFVFDKLINEVYTDKDYFDFGISTEEEGRFLNEGLIEQKQEFGGRALLYDSYKLEIK